MAPPRSRASKCDRGGAGVASRAAPHSRLLWPCRSPLLRARLTPQVGFVGWRGMVGSVLVERMLAEKDFEQDFEATFFTTSNVGGKGPEVGKEAPPLVDAKSIKDLAAMDIIVTCQGGDYTNEVHPKLRAEGWTGYWIDAASALRMKDDAIIILDPINRAVIDQGLKDGVKDYIGGNCTVSLMLMGLGGLFEKGWVEWVTSMTYQAASGAGAANMRELGAQKGAIAKVPEDLQNPRSSILDFDRAINTNMAGEDFPAAAFGAPLAGSLIPWIDKALDNGQTKEEWKAMAEANKIMNLTGDAQVRERARPAPGGCHGGGEGGGWGGDGRVWLQRTCEQGCCGCVCRFRSMGAACALARCAATLRPSLSNSRLATRTSPSKKSRPPLQAIMIGVWGERQGGEEGERGVGVFARELTGVRGEWVRV